MPIKNNTKWKENADLLLQESEANYHALRQDLERLGGVS